MENKEKHLGSVRREEAPKSRKRDEEKEPFSWKKEILSWIQILAAAAVIAYVLTTYISQQHRAYRIHGKYHHVPQPGTGIQTYL